MKGIFAFAVGFQLLILAAVMLLGAFCAQYDVSVLTHHTIAFGWAFLLNLVLGGLSIPIAIVLKVLTLVGIVAA